MALFLFGTAMAIYFGLHSVLASHKIKALLTQKFIDQKYYRLLYNGVAVFLLLPLAFFYQKINARALFENANLATIGSILFAVGVVLSLLALRQYDLSEFAGTQQLKNKTSPSRQTLKVSGFNAWVRHPLYFSGLLVLWGLFLGKQTDLFLVVATVSTIYLYIGTKLEEEKLVTEFGAAYTAYQQKVGMLLPRFSIPKD